MNWKDERMLKWRRGEMEDLNVLVKRGGEVILGVKRWK